MGIAQVELTASEEEETIDNENNQIEEEEGLFGLPQPITIDDHTEHQADVSDKVPNLPLTPVRYPRASIEFRSISSGTIVPIRKWMTQEPKGLQSSNIHVSYKNRQIKPKKDNGFIVCGPAFKMEVIHLKTTRMCLATKIKEDGGSP
jgi:hypothetical protein